MGPLYSGSRIFRGEKIPEKFQKANLDFPCASNYSPSIYIALGIIGNPEMI